ncbi:MAG: NAD-dependent dehydratase, partial [Cyclobacteriaceae bacterium]
MKKYVITGSVGHISKPVIEGLIKAGNDVKVITSNPGKVKEIESLGANALTGSLFDAAFVTKAFEGTEVVYTMVPPIWQTNDWKASQLEIVQNYVQALKANKSVKYIVNLSSVGAHLGSGTGPIDAVSALEKELNKLSGIQVKHLRPTFFFYNFLSQLPMLKHAGIMGGNYGEQKIALVDPKDIAEAALEELLKLDFNGNSVRYIA